jgi:hypothetical protein
MKQFIEANECAFVELAQSLNGQCMRFRNETMPQGCTPASADVGFELSPRNGRIQLCVQDGVRYTGDNPSLRQWFGQGWLEFDGVHALTAWLRDELNPAMPRSGDNPALPEVPESPAVSAGATPVTSGQADSPAPAGRPSRQRAQRRPEGAITDTAQVTERIREDSEPLFLDEDEVFRTLSQGVVGQDDSLRVLALAISGHVARANPRRPLTLFAIGPSGVGKTRTGLSIVSVLNNKGQSGRYEFLRLDMCEYREAHRVSQLIGSPQGYAGYGEGAQLTDALARNPRTVVLFDEIEKAHPDILKVLMNAMDAGRLSTAGRAGDGSREVDCRHAVFFFSSNLDCESILRSLEQREAIEDMEAVDEVCRAHLKAAGIPPELIGRIGHFLVYRPLNAESKAEIAAVQIRETAEEYGLDVRYVAPDVVVDVIQAVRARGGGARVYAYQIDRLLGRIFREAAYHRHTSPIRLLGPAPYRYELIPDGDPAAGAEPPATLTHPSAVAESTRTEMNANEQGSDQETPEAESVNEQEQTIQEGAVTT